jgi:hypothetical protein
VFLVAEQAGTQVVSGNEIAVSLRWIGAAAQDYCVQFLEFRQSFSELTGFPGSTGGVVFGIEIKHHPLSPVLRKGYGDLILVGQDEIGCGLSFPDLAHEFFPFPGNGRFYPAVFLYLL